MRYIVGAILLSLAFLASPAKAQDALVVQTCGTLPLAYAPGATRLVTVDTTGKLCSSAGGGGGVTVGAAVTGGSAGCNLFVTSTSTVGCVAAVSETDTGSVLTLTGNLAMPTTASASVGVITFGGARFLHDAGSTTNVFLGTNAGNLTLTGTGETCVGTLSCGAIAAGNSNTAFGASAYAAGTGGNNVAVGSSAMPAAGVFSNSTAVGAGTLGSQTGGGNTAVGRLACGNVGAGSNNICMGESSGLGITTGAGNTILGQGCGGLAAGLTNGIVLGNAACAAKLDFGVTTASIWTFLGGTIAAPLTTDATHTDASVCRDTTSGQFFFGSGAAGICLGTSGRQFKTDIVPMVAGIDELMKMDFVNYRFLPGYGDNGARKQYGLIAQDVEAVLPDLAGHNVMGETINYDIGAVWMMYGHAIQQLKADFEAYKRDHP